MLALVWVTLGKVGYITCGYRGNTDLGFLTPQVLSLTTNMQDLGDPGGLVAAPLVILAATHPRLAASTAQALEGGESRCAALLAALCLVTGGLGAMEDLGEEEIRQVGEKEG